MQPRHIWSIARRKLFRLVAVILIMSSPLPSSPKFGHGGEVPHILFVITLWRPRPERHPEAAHETYTFGGRLKLGASSFKSSCGFMVSW